MKEKFDFMHKFVRPSRSYEYCGALHIIKFIASHLLAALASCL
jgi:hypothetical protein